jgi:hypothetical protein
MIELTMAITVFWNCEVEWLRGERSPGDMLICIEIAEQIKREQFHGDFQKYLEWWRENLDREYQLRGYQLN